MTPTDQVSFMTQTATPYTSFWDSKINAPSNGNISLFQNYFQPKTQTDYCLPFFQPTTQPDYSLAFFQPLNFNNTNTPPTTYDKTSSNSAVNWALGQVGHKGGQTYGAGKNAWCAAFASTAYGGKDAPWGFQLGVSGIKNWAVKNGRYKPGSSIDGVKPGDVFICQRDTCGRSHTGIIVKIENGKIHTVEGNTSGDKVATREYTIGTKFDGFVSV